MYVCVITIRFICTPIRIEIYIYMPVYWQVITLFYPYIYIYIYIYVGVIKFLMISSVSGLPKHVVGLVHCGCFCRYRRAHLSVGCCTAHAPLV